MTRRISSNGRSGVLADLFDAWLTLEFLRQLLLNVTQATQYVDHVNWNTNGARLISDGTRDRLANPPSGISRELKAAAEFILVYCTHKARVAFLDQVQEAQPTIAILLGDRDDQAQVALRQFTLDCFEFLEMFAEGCAAVLKTAWAFLVSMIS